MLRSREMHVSDGDALERDRRSRLELVLPLDESLRFSRLRWASEDSMISHVPDGSVLLEADRSIPASSDVGARNSDARRGTGC